MTKQLGCSTGRMAALLFLFAFFLSFPAAVGAKTFTYKVKHLHAVGGCQGKLIVGESEIRYETDYRKDARIWTYIEIKDIQRKGQRKLSLYTYEDQMLKLGRDKPFDFEFLDGKVTDELFNFIATRLRQNPEEPMPAQPPGGRYELAVKHDHLFGGCQGVLKITDNFVEYVTDDESDQRLWKYMDIKRVESDSAYQLAIYTYEDQTLQFGRDKVFDFQLKEPLEPKVLQFLQDHVMR